jgi:cytoskeletal protein CcmA (bactofilin family)
MSESSKVKQTVLEEGTEFEGSIRSQCAITVSGNLKGDVSAPALTITRSGSVQGQVKVTELRSEGDIAGEIDAETVELSGHVSDQTTIRATSLQVRLGQDGTSGKLQVTFGSCDLHVGNPVVTSPSGPVKKEKKEQPRVVSALAEPVPELEVK